MKISGTRVSPNSVQAPSKRVTQDESSEVVTVPSDTFEMSPTHKAIHFAMGSSLGAVGVGATAVLGISAFKSFASGDVSAGLRLTAATVAVGVAFGGRTFTDTTAFSEGDGGSSVYGYVAGGLAASIATGLALF